MAGDEEDGREEWPLFMFGGCSRISLLSNQLLMLCWLAWFLVLGCLEFAENVKARQRRVEREKRATPPESKEVSRGGEVLLLT